MQTGWVRRVLAIRIKSRHCRFKANCRTLDYCKKTYAFQMLECQRSNLTADGAKPIIRPGFRGFVILKLPQYLQEQAHGWRS